SQSFETIEAHSCVEARTICNYVREHAAHVAILNIAVENQRLLRAQLNLHIGRTRIRRRQKTDARECHLLQLFRSKWRFGGDVHRLAVVIIAVLHPWKDLSSNQCSEDNEKRSAPRGPQSHR